MQEHRVNPLGIGSFGPVEEVDAEDLAARVRRSLAKPNVYYVKVMYPNEERHKAKQIVRRRAANKNARKARRR